MNPSLTDHLLMDIHSFQSLAITINAAVNKHVVLSFCAFELIFERQIPKKYDSWVKVYMKL